MLTKEEKRIIREHADKIIGWDKRVNPDWKKEWKYFIKRDYSWGNIIELNVFKIVQMREFMKNHSIVCQEEVDKQVKQMTEVIELGYKLLEDEYEDDAHKWFRENSIPVTLICEKNNFKNVLHSVRNEGLFDGMVSKIELETDKWLRENNLTKKDVSIAYTTEWTNGNTDENNSEEFRRRSKEAWKERQKDKDKFFKLIAKHCDDWGD